MNRVDIAIEQIRRTRQYTTMVLDHTDPARWYELVGPANGSQPGSHIGWQVGHITWAQAMHVLGTVCGMEDRPIPAEWGKLFGKGSTPGAEPEQYPSPGDLRGGFDAVFEASMAALPSMTDEVLDRPASHPTGMIPDNFAMLLYNARHEMLHVGQIGLIRRLLGERPYR